MNDKRFIVLLLAIAFCLLIVPIAHACGCGLALERIEVFNDLKETQAYLMIEVIDETTYNEMPFFRMVSMDEPYDVTIVFPIDGIPYDVEGRTIPAQQFLEEYGLLEADEHITKQSFKELGRKIGEGLKESSTVMFYMSHGILGGGFALGFTKMMFSGMDGFSETKSGGLAPVAHFEFEGGSLDIYDVNSMNTLREFVDTINITLTGDVQELVTKYNEYYVAVLYLSVPSVLSESMREDLNACPEKTAQVKEMLQEATAIPLSQIEQITGINGYEIYQLRQLEENLASDYFPEKEVLQNKIDEIKSLMDPCGLALYTLIDSVTNVNSNLNGTLVNMKFQGTSEFFYPTSIVNSYKYPITDEKYYIKTPSDLHIDLEKSFVDKKANFDSSRWYKVTSSEEDIKGTIIKAGIGTRFGDFMRSINEVLYKNSSWLVFLIYILIIVLPFIYYNFKVDETITWNHIVYSIGLFIIGGFILSAILMFVSKKWKFACTLLTVYLLLMILAIVF